MTQNVLSKLDRHTKGIVTIAATAMVVLAVILASSVQPVRIAQAMGQGEDVPPDDLTLSRTEAAASARLAGLADYHLGYVPASSQSSSLARVQVAPIGSDPWEPGHPGWASSSAFAIMRRATARYQRIEVAEADGFIPLFECIEHETDGAMGVHYINTERFDSDLTLAEPEVLLYQPKKNGQMKLMGVEFIIPDAAWSEADAPVFLDQTLKYKTSVGPHDVDPYYEVHVWAWGNNPSGMFADWNPQVACIN